MIDEHNTRGIFEFPISKLFTFLSFSREKDILAVEQIDRKMQSWLVTHMQKSAIFILFSFCDRRTQWHYIYVDYHLQHPPHQHHQP